MISYRASTNGLKHAVYCGACRVGYIDSRNNGERIWTLIMLQPTGTAYMGRADDIETAKAGVEAAFKVWCEAAGLVMKESTDGA